MYQKDMTDTRLKVVKEYVKILQLEKALEVYKASQKERKEELKMQKVFYDLGIIDKSEILKVESSLYETQSDILEAGNSISTEKIVLKKIMGISLKENIKLKDITTSILSPEDIKVEMDKKIALKESLEIKQQKLNLDIKKLEQKVSRSDFFPKIDLDYTYESPEEASFSKASQGNDWEWTVGVSFEWDIFNFGSSMDSYERKKLETEKVSILVEDSKEELEQNIITYYLNMKTLYNLIDTKEKYYETLKETYEIDKEKYANRLIDTVDYLQTESDLREAEVEYINSQLDYYLAYEEYLNIIK
jgi:outer membrane protein TolC